MDETLRPIDSPLRLWRPALALILLVLVTYLPTMHAGFIWDDDSYVEGNATLHSLAGLAAIWTDFSATPQYYPLVHTSFWIESHLFGTKSAVPFHIDNVLLHALAAVLLWWLLRQLRVPGAWLAAAIWAVHPMNVETVAWVTERKNLLSAVFYLSAFGVYLKAIEGEDGGRPLDRRRYVVALGLFVLALLSKTVAATFPGAVLVVLWWQRGRLRWRDIVRLLPFFIIGAAMGAVTGYLERAQVGARGAEWSLTPIDRVLIAGRATWFYAGKFVWPVKLIFIYPRWTIDRNSLTAWLYPAAAAVVLATLVALRRRRGPLAIALLFVGTLVPALGFVNIYPMRYSFVADHFAFLATPALAAAVAAVLVRLPKPWTSVVGGVLLATLAGRSFAREFTLHDRLTLWQQTVADNPNSWMVHTNLGHALAANHQPDAAWAQYQQATALAPERAETHFNVGIGWAIRNRMELAIQEFQRATEVDPGFMPAYSYLSKAYMDMKQPQDAELWARRGIARDPQVAGPHIALAHVFDFDHNLPEAIEQYELAVAADPRQADVHADLANACMEAQRYPEAMREFEATVAIEPRNAQALTVLGNLNLAIGRPDRAASCFRRALAINPNLKPARIGLALVTGSGQGS